MNLPRTTTCTLFSIQQPMWLGDEKKRVVGLAKNRIGLHNEIEFTYVRKSDGKLSIPEHYYISGEKLAQRDFRRQVRKGITLLLIPLSELEVLHRTNPTPILEPEEVKEELQIRLI